MKVDPRVVYFSPRGRPGRPDESQMSVDEYEAMRLADYLKQAQKAAAKDMGVSQQTFSRILRQARFRMADALINGKILRIQGGKYIVVSRDDFSAKPQERRR